MEEIELIVFVDNLLGQAVAVERFSTQGKDGLRLGIAHLCDCSACRVTLRDEYSRLIAAVFLGVGAECVIIVDVAIAEFLIVKAHLLCLFACHFRYSSHRLAFLLIGGDFLEHYVCRLRILMEIVVEFFLQEVTYEFIDCHRTVGGNLLAAEFGLSLRFKHWLLNADTDGCHNTVADIGIFVVLP